MRSILFATILGVTSQVSVPTAAADPAPRVFPCLKPLPGFESDDAGRFPINWSPEQVQWSTSLAGYGQSCPVLWENAVYVTSVLGPKKENLIVECLDLQSGKKSWEHRMESSFSAENSPMISRAAPTPVVDNSGVYIFFESGDLIKLTHAGAVRWKRSLQKDYGEFVNKFGLSSTPCQTQDRLFVLLDHSGKSFLVGIDKTTGKTLFESERGLRAHSWSSPAVINFDGESLIVCSSVGSIDAYRTNGELVCSYTKVGGNSVATPYDLGAGRFLVSSLVRPADGPSENALVSNLLCRIIKSHGGYEFRVDWIADEARGSFCSPVEHHGFVYFINPQGVLFCLDAQTGQQYYAKRTPSGACWSTPFPVGDHLYLFGKDGVTSVVQIGKEFHLLNKGNRTWIEEDEEQQTPPQNPPSRPSAPTLYAGIPVPNGFLIRRGDTVYFIGK